MSREVKRVPLDFDWPHDKVWSRFLTPESLHGDPCKDCAGRGDTPAAQWVWQLCYRMGMLADDVRAKALGRDLHPWLQEDRHPPVRWHAGIAEVQRPSPDILDLMAGISGKERDDFLLPFGGGNVEYDIYRALVKASGIERWGICPTCDGRGEVERYPGQHAESELWEPTEPPTGDGWQLWETVSEGSPISPVFPTADGLAEWMSSPEYHWGSSRPLTRAQADAFVGQGWAPSFIHTPETGLIPGEAYALASNREGAE